MRPAAKCLLLPAYHLHGSLKVTQNRADVIRPDCELPVLFRAGDDYLKPLLAPF
jgi:hypothetical protein